MGLDTGLHAKALGEQGQRGPLTERSSQLGQMERGFQGSGLEGFLIVESFIRSHKGECWGPAETPAGKLARAAHSERPLTVGHLRST